MTEQNNKRGGCGGCLLRVAGVMLLGVLLLAALVFGRPLLRSWGIGAPTAEEMLSGAPDPVATEAVQGLFEARGLEEVDAWVVPLKGSDEQLAILSFDESAAVGDLQSVEEAEAFLLDTLGELSATNRAEGLGISRVAVDYRGESGDSLLSFTAPEEAIAAYSAGELSRREFMAQVDIDFSNLISAAELRELAEEEAR